MQLRLLNLDRATIPRDYIVPLEVIKELSPGDQAGAFPFDFEVGSAVRAATWSIGHWIPWLGYRSRAGVANSLRIAEPFRPDIVHMYEKQELV